MQNLQSTFSRILTLGSVLVALCGVCHAAVPADFDGDGKSDLAVWRPSDQNFYVYPSSFTTVQGTCPPCFAATSGFVGCVAHMGSNATDVPRPGDFDGDGKIDVAVWQPTTLNFRLRFSTSSPTCGTFNTGSFGPTILSSDKIEVANITSDGLDDIMFHRRQSVGSNAVWFVRDSSNGYVDQYAAYTSYVTAPEQTPFVLISGHYDSTITRGMAMRFEWTTSGLNKGMWWIGTRIVGASSATTYWHFISSAIANEYATRGDYLGPANNLLDYVVFDASAGNWFVKYNGGGTGNYTWGISGDKPVSGDWDGVGGADPAVWRPSDGNWFVLHGSTCTGGMTSTGYGGCQKQWGLTGDIPIEALQSMQ